MIYGERSEEPNTDTEVRTGCWVCTVVRQDRSAEQLIRRGHPIFTHLKRFRDWLSRFRDNPEYRCVRRRNGAVGPGPITLRGRRIILNRLIAVQKQVKTDLISSTELREIERLWNQDSRDNRYRTIIENGR